MHPLARPQQRLVDRRRNCCPLEGSVVLQRCERGFLAEERRSREARLDGRAAGRDDIGMD